MEQLVGELIPRDAFGPIESASFEIRTVSEAFASERLARRRLPSLLTRSDWILSNLEELNLQGVRRVPKHWLARMLALVADLPFVYDGYIGQRPSPTAAIDIMFDLQEGILELIAGRADDDGDLLLTAS